MTNALTRVTALVFVLTSATVSAQITIFSAANVSPHGPSCNATPAFASLCNGRDECSVPLTHAYCADPEPGVFKHWVVHYQCAGAPAQTRFNDDSETLNIYCSKARTVIVQTTVKSHEGSAGPRTITKSGCAHAECVDVCAKVPAHATLVRVEPKAGATESFLRSCLPSAIGDFWECREQSHFRFDHKNPSIDANNNVCVQARNWAPFERWVELDVTYRSP